MRIVLPVILAFYYFIASASAQQKPIPDDFLKQLSTDLATLLPDQSKSNLSYGNYLSLDNMAVKIIKPKTPIYTSTDTTAKPIFVAEKNKEFPLINKVGNWYAVKYGARPNELGWITTMDATPVQVAGMLNEAVSAAAAAAAAAQEQINQLLARVAAMREKYKENPYVKVKGFTLDAKLPPGVSVEFEFKD